MLFLIEICENYDFLVILKFLWKIVKIIFIVAPILAILMIVVDFSKSVIASKEDDMRKNLNVIIKRVLYCVAVFLVPTIVSFVMGLLGSFGVPYMNCLSNATDDEVLESLKVSNSSVSNDSSQEKETVLDDSSTNDESSGAMDSIEDASQSDVETEKDSMSVEEDSVSETTSQKSRLEDAESYNEIKVLKRITSADLEKRVTVKGTNGCGAAQSFSVVGDSFVTAQVNSSDTKTYIQVYNKKTGKKKRRVMTDFHHANGMAYNPRTGFLYVVHNDQKKYSFFSASQLVSNGKIEATTKNASVKISGMAYDNTTNQYYFAKGSKVYVFDSQMKQVKKIDKIRTGTPQDIGAYKGLILVIVYKGRSNSYPNAIDIYRSSDGKYVGSYDVNVSGYELEGIDYYGEGNLFALYFNVQGNSTDYIYVTDKIEL